MKLEIHKKMAKPVSYGGKRDKKDIKYIVIHYTGNKGDTAAGNANYFATGNTRQAGAHFFIDKAGEVYKTINMNLTAWSVGGFFSQSGGAGAFYKKCTNSNSVSIELCDLVSGEPSFEQMKACKELVSYIRKYCPNAKTVIRHWDVNGKCCPATMIGKNSKAWEHFKSYIENGYQYMAQITEDTTIYTTSSKKTSSGTIKKGKAVKVVRKLNGRVRIAGLDSEGRKRWIDGKAVKEK